MLNPQISDEAAEWLVTLRDEPADARVHDDFMAWLRKSPEHVGAYLGLVTLWKDLPGTAGPGSAELIARAREEGNVLPLELESMMDVSRVPRYRARNMSRPLHRSPVLAAAASAACVVAGVLGWLHFIHAPSHSTAVGEQRALMLSDGSRVELNSDSRIRVLFDEGRRHVKLLKGQALFQVAKDPDRPFTVESGAARVRAVGTQFDVFRRPHDTVVTVVEGRVAVQSREGAGGGVQPEKSSVLLSAGDSMVVAPRVEQRVVKADVAAATAWTRGQLMFRSAPLSDVVAEFNRYNTRQLRLGAAVDDFPVTAVFASTDPKMLIEFLRQQSDVEIRMVGDEIRIVPAAVR